MKVLVVGTGGREHAIAWRLSQSDSVSRIVCPNGNPGIELVAETPAVELKFPSDWAAWAANQKFDLVVIGPEGPLEAGLADECLARGVPVFGPPRAGARIESSKACAKEIMAAAGIPTARAESFDDAAAAKDFAKALGLPVVIKADGLAAGKGVTVARTRAEADQAIDENLVGRRFGGASSRVLVEEFMEGVEASIFGLCDGKTVFPLVPAQDHKAVFDNDEGPNTGGMGAYAPTPFVTEEIFTAAFSEVLRPALEEMVNRGIDYRGVLYAGLMLTNEGPKVVEFNCRFGDPETQVVLPLLEGDFGEILLACAEGRLEPLTHAVDRETSLAAPTVIGTRPEYATTVVLASGGYPGKYETGRVIRGLEHWEQRDDVMVFHAGTARNAAGETVTAGGRVLACTAWERTLARATEKAYDVARGIDFEGCHLRSDIAAKALN